MKRGRFESSRLTRNRIELAAAGALAALVLGAAPVQAALTADALLNLTANQTFTVWSPPSAQQVPVRQVFMNSFDVVDQIQVAVAGPMPSGTGTVTVQLRDGCGTPLGGASSASYTASGITAPGSSKFVPVNLPGVAVPYGTYVYFEVTSTPQALLANTDRYLGGRLFGANPEFTFPAKKQDLMFQINGRRDVSKSGFPAPTTNVICPTKCLLVNPSGVEVNSWGVENQLNIIIRERDVTGKGSFWEDNNTRGGLSRLRSEIGRMLQDASGLQNTFPYNNYYFNDNNPAYNIMYYPNMNFYMAVENPAKDLQSATGWARGLYSCANIDAAIEVTSGTTFGGSMGGFIGDVSRPGPTARNWGASQGRVLVHEVFGHGFASLDDEYIYSQPTPTTYEALLAKNEWGFLPNALPLTSTACNAWCSGTQNVSWLVQQMASDRDAPCWSRTTQSACTPATIPTNTEPTCRWIGGLSSVAYWGSHKCIPANAAAYSIGVGCGMTGNDGCYPLAPHGSKNGAIMDVVQPNASIMQSFHTHTPAPGFGTHVENHIKDVLDCVYSPAPCSVASSPRCAALFARYGTSGTGFHKFLDSAAPCTTDGWIRRR